MYKWINVHIYKCLNPKYTHGQLYNVQMYNVQKYNVQKDDVLNMSAVLGLIMTFFFVGAGAAKGQVSCQAPWKNIFGSNPGPPVCPLEPIFFLF